MKCSKRTLVPRIQRLACALVVFGSINLATAIPYATCLTNDGAGTISFRLNQATATNDTLLVISSGGAVTNILQSPGTNFFPRGLVVTNLGIAAGDFKVQINHIGSGVISTSGPPVAFNAPRGVAVNRNPSSPYFGHIYVANSAAGTKGDGVFVFSSDLADITGQGATARTGGYTGFGNSTQWSPYRVSVAPDDRVLISDVSDASGNLISLDPLLSAPFQYVLKAITTNGNLTNVTAAPPIGSNNVHGSVHVGVIVGTGANRVLYTIDEDYQTDPEGRINKEWNSLWKYDIGNATLPWSNPPVAKLMTPYIRTFASQNMQVVPGPNGYLYVLQRRSNVGQYSVYIVDPANPVDPTTYDGAQGGYFWNSQDASAGLGWSDDLLREVIDLTVSSDGKFLAGIVSQTTPANNNSGTGQSITNLANDVILVPLVNGIPQLAQRSLYRGVGTVSLGRALAFDAANNLYLGSSGQAIVQPLDIGQSGTAVTGSDGTFVISIPSTEINLSSPSNLASEAGPTPATVTVTRTSTDLGAPLTVFYTIGGTATNGVDYTAITNRITIPANQTSADIVITPIDDAIPELTEEVRINITGTGFYTVGTQGGAVVTILDNETPQLVLMSGSPVYEGNSFDVGNVVIRRLGDTNLAVALTTSSFALSGTAVANVDYAVTNLPVTIDPGVVDYTLSLVTPIDDSAVEGVETIVVSAVADTGYTVATNQATISLVDDDRLPETVLFSETFATEASSNNWVLKFGSLDGVPDYAVTWAFDYSTALIPQAPNGGDSLGLKISVNDDTTAAAAGLNLYNAIGTFSGNYALRFDMFLVMGSGSFTTEYAMMGLNHTGNETNWFRNSGNGYTNVAYDGVFAYIEADGATLGNNGTVLADYVLNTGPVSNEGGVWGPSPKASRVAADFYGTFKTPPWTPGANFGGVPSNLEGSITPSWAEVELMQIGTVVTLKVNNTVIASYNNTNAAKSGKIMLGYDDPYDSIGPSGSVVVFDNVRVVRLNGLAITAIQAAGANAVVNFAFDLNDEPSAFKLQSAATVIGPYADDNSASIVRSAPGQYQATTAKSGAVRYYRIRHL